MLGRKTLSILVLMVMCCSVLVSTVPSSAVDIGGVLKGAGIVYLVDRFSDQLNDFINKLTINKGVGVADRTKVVPIISIGNGNYAGAAQVSGPASMVDQVNAVAMMEASMSGRTFRIKALIPVSSKNVIKEIKRVSGVGVSAIIDVKL